MRREQLTHREKESIKIITKKLYFFKNNNREYILNLA